ncbi:hypothetical protein QQ045_020803 [Rhodiola kirilowii]
MNEERVERIRRRIRFTVFYGNPVTHRRSESWNLLRKLSDNNSLLLGEESARNGKCKALGRRWKTVG